MLTNPCILLNRVINHPDRLRELGDMQKVRIFVLCFS